MQRLIMTFQMINLKDALLLILKFYDFINFTEQVKSKKLGYNIIERPEVLYNTFASSYSLELYYKPSISFIFIR